MTNQDVLSSINQIDPSLYLEDPRFSSVSIKEAFTTAWSTSEVVGLGLGASEELIQDVAEEVVIRILDSANTVSKKRYTALKEKTENASKQVYYLCRRWAENLFDSPRLVDKTHTYNGSLVSRVDFEDVAYSVTDREKTSLRSCVSIYDIAWAVLDKWELTAKTRRGLEAVLNGGALSWFTSAISYGVNTGKYYDENGTPVYLKNEKPRLNAWAISYLDSLLTKASEPVGGTLFDLGERDNKEFTRNIRRLSKKLWLEAVRLQAIASSLAKKSYKDKEDWGISYKLSPSEIKSVVSLFGK